MSDEETRQTFEAHLNTIEDQITSPRRVSADGIDASTRSAEDIIRLANYTRSSKRLGYGLKACIHQQIRPPDAHGQNWGSV